MVEMISDISDFWEMSSYLCLKSASTGQRPEAHVKGAGGFILVNT